MKALLLQSRSKKNIEKVAAIAAEDTRAFRELIDMMLDKKEAYLGTLAAWAMSHACDRNTRLAEPYYAELIALVKDTEEDAIKRNIVRVWSFAVIPEEFRWEIADICFHFLKGHQEAVAVKAFSITVLQHLMQYLPELKEEVVFELEKQLPHGSAAFKVRANAFLKKYPV